MTHRYRIAHKQTTEYVNEAAALTEGWLARQFLWCVHQFCESTLLLESYVEKSVWELRAGKGQPHELIEVEDE